MQQTIPATAKALGLEIEDFPEFIDSDSVDKTLERYLWFPGDIISPRRKQETRQHEGIGLSLNGKPFRITQNGGDEWQSVCLVRTKGFVPRAFITPLETGANWVPPELIPYGGEMSAFSGAHTGPQEIAGGVIVGGKNRYLRGERMYPGHAATWILANARNDQGFSRGLIELESLRGSKWTSGAASEIQSLYFPAYPELPATLAGLQSAIEAITKAQRGDIREIGEQFVYACDEFRQWGLNFVANEHNLVKIGTTQQGWTYRYSDTARLLMTQLEITAEDEQFQTVAKMQEEQSRSAIAMMAAMAEKGADNGDLMKMFLQSQAQIAEALTKLASNGQPAKETPKEEPKPEKPATPAPVRTK